MVVIVFGWIVRIVVFGGEWSVFCISSISFDNSYRFDCYGCNWEIWIELFRWFVCCLIDGDCINFCKYIDLRCVLNLRFLLL